MDVLVIDIGGSHVKLGASSTEETCRFASGPAMTPAQMVAQAKQHANGWRYDAISIGYPGRVRRNVATAEPGNLGPGWVGFDFEQVFGCQIRLVNDAAMQALGAYDGQRMLFLGLGTGLGSALVADRVLVPLELGSLHHGGPEPLFERLGSDGLERLGERAWAELVREVAPMLQEAFLADYVVLGGGNAERVTDLPPDVRRGGNDDALRGGVRLWEEDVEGHDRPHSHIWRVVG